MKGMHNTPPWVDSIRRNFDFIAKHLLPSVGNSDNGKVLSVVDGKWSPADAGSGGLTLYGPYYAQKESDTTIVSGLTDEIVLDNIMDDDALVYELNADVPADTKFILNGYTGQNDRIIDVNMPWYDENDGWTYPVVGYANNGESSITIRAQGTMVTFYATNPLPIKEP